MFRFSDLLRKPSTRAGRVRLAILSSAVAVLTGIHIDSLFVGPVNQHNHHLVVTNTPLSGTNLYQNQVHP